MKEKWVVAAKKADFNRFGQELHIDPVLVRIIRNRDLTELSQMQNYLYGGREALYDPHLLKDADRAADLVLEQISDHKRIRIIGDYDIDGIMSTYILYSALSRLKARVDYAIPDRILDGYGLNEHLVTRANEDGIDMILTCDNGISAISQIHLARELGMKVVVTDHHEVPFEESDGHRKQMLSDANAIVNPKQDDCPYPFKELCGAAVAWKLVQVLYEKAGIPMEEADAFLENVGFATVGDVMPLREENRILVKLGLASLNQTENPGMKALILQNDLSLGNIKAYHIGFKLGPCLNASGRLDTAKLSMELLMCRDQAKASVLAGEILELNESRKLLTAQATKEALQLAGQPEYVKDHVLVLYLPECHESLAGIVAGRVREQYHKPTFVLTKGEECVKGSARSIESYSMYEEMCKCRELFLKFGGHPMAAGCSLTEENVPKLRTALNANETMTAQDLTPKIMIDVPMPIDYIYMDLVKQLELLEPFGRGNEKPVFADRNLTIESLRILGKERNVVRMSLRSSNGTSMDGVYFGDPEGLRQTLQEKYGKEAADDTMNGRCFHNLSLHFTYYPKIDHYYAQARLQLAISGFC